MFNFTQVYRGHISGNGINFDLGDINDVEHTGSTIKLLCDKLYKELPISKKEEKKKEKKESEIKCEMTKEMTHTEAKAYAEKNNGRLCTNEEIKELIRTRFDGGSIIPGSDHITAISDGTN